MPERLERLNMIVLTVVIVYAIAILRTLNDVTLVTPLFDRIIAILTSIGFYRLLLVMLYALVLKNRTLLQLYWGRLYLDGLWSYSYRKEGDTTQKRYYGVWRFEQDLVRTTVIGFGLDEQFERRSIVRSVTDLIDNRGVHEIVNIRSDAVDPEKTYYSTTTLAFDKNVGGLLQQHPVKIRCQTTIYGGVLTGEVHRDIFVKHEHAQTEDQVIAELRKQVSTR